MAGPARLAGVGVFVLAGFVLFAIALFMIGERQLAFAQRFVIYTEFTTITGLQPGAIVRVSGAPAGSVTGIDPPADPEAKFRVRLEITEDLHQLVRTDSVAAIQTEGLLGGSFLAVSTGTNDAPRAPDGSTLPSREPFLLADLFQQMSDTVAKVNATIDTLTTGIAETLVSVDTTVDNANALINDISDDVRILASAGARITSDAAQIAESIRKGEGTVGKLLNDDELYQRVTGIARSAETIAADTQRVVQQARQALDRLQAQDGQTAGVTASLKQTLGEAQTAMTGLSENMEALKRSFFFRGFFNRRGYFNLADISPDEYRKGVLTKGSNRRASRVWLRDDDLFVKPQGSNDGEQLTNEGRARLDAALAPNLPRVADSIVMIEGYSWSGSVPRQYVESRARAALVRQYLIERFHLDPDGVGLMPLGADAVGSPQGATWSGIALAVFVER
jgi:phospholipid/cholesterol/gamma-HCH transport system substrate-binding protein